MLIFDAAPDPTCRGAGRGSERGSGIVVPVGLARMVERKAAMIEIMVVSWCMIYEWDCEVSWVLTKTLVDWRARVSCNIDVHWVHSAVLPALYICMIKVRLVTLIGIKDFEGSCLKLKRSFFE